ncbi:GtrA family protein [Jannaschia faecimaris]|nr:GtrA family protein [Jannaschia faecimaris]
MTRNLRFIATGVIVNVTLYGLLAAVLNLGVDYKLATTAIYILGMTWSYLQNRLWSWQSRAPIAQSVLRFLGVYAGIFVAHMGLVMALVEGAGIPPLWAVLLSVAVLVTPIFILFDRFVFKEAT